MRRNDALVLTEGIKILTEGLGMVDTERFISLILKERFDYTNWQKNLFSGVNVIEKKRGKSSKKSETVNEVIENLSLMDVSNEQVSNMLFC